MPARLAQAPRLEFGNGASFIVTHVGEMEARPADSTVLDLAPSAFVWTGYRDISMTVPPNDFNAAFAIMERSGHQPCTLVRGDERFALAFAAQNLSTSAYDATKTQGQVRGEFDGLLYEKAADGQPVTDEAMIAYLVEKYKPREYTAEELAELEQYADCED